MHLVYPYLPPSLFPRCHTMPQIILNERGFMKTHEGKEEQRVESTLSASVK